ncbi:MAG: 1-phosphofructokinase [Epulopiscium sp. Nele67-Bin001]|nr:MAG: 1-phosphofructokinase [Epulopiscium sp. Nele67-Bin001]
MIITITLNPSLDYIVEMDKFELGAVNRSTCEHVLPGGKGINVSIILNRLHIPTKALGFTAGFIGHDIEQLLAKYHVASDFIKVEEGLSRINVKLRGRIKETEINGNGPVIKSTDLSKLEEKLRWLQSGDIVVLAGSIPLSVPCTIYNEIIEMLEDVGVMIVIDAAGDLLKNTLKHRPFLIKPNHIELGELFGVNISSKDEVIVYAKRLQTLGARNVLVSMAGDGAVLLTAAGDIFKHNGLKGFVVNSVGAGDSMVAGFLAGFVKYNSYCEAFKWGIAAGSASAFSDLLATRRDIELLYKELCD